MHRIVLFFLVLQVGSVLGLCPTGSVRYAASQSEPGTCYRVVGTVAAYDMAAEACVAMSGRLARIPNWDVLRLISSLLKSSPRRSCWIDALDARRSPNIKSYPWMSGEPNGHYDDCVSMGVAGGWFDLDCATAMCYICERAELPARGSSEESDRQMREADEEFDTGAPTVTSTLAPSTTSPAPVPPQTFPSPTSIIPHPSPSDAAPPPGSTDNIHSNVVVQGQGSSIVSPIQPAGGGFPAPSPGSQPTGGGLAGSAGGTTTAGAAGSTTGPGGFGGAFASSFGSAFSNVAGGNGSPQQPGSTVPSAVGIGSSFGGGFGYGGRVNLWIIVNNYKTGVPGSKTPTLESQVVRQGERNVLVFP